MTISLLDINSVVQKEPFYGFLFNFHLQTDEEEVITFLLSTEIIPLCLRIMESGSELSKTVATFILQKILLDEKGLSYICQTFERFSHVAIILVRLEIKCYFMKEKSNTISKHFLGKNGHSFGKRAIRQVT